MRPSRPASILGTLCRSRDTWAVAGLLLLLLLAWISWNLPRPPATSSLLSGAVPALLCLGAAAAWLLARVAAPVAARRQNASFVRALSQLGSDRADDGDGSQRAKSPELASVLSRLGQRPVGHGGGDRWLKDLPWYVTIGPPGAGTAAALRQAGLAFPIGGTEALSEIAGTRACNWLVSDAAVLIDTGGRYTCEGAEEEIGAEAWQRFLGLLKRHRGRRAIDGVLVVLPAPELIAGRSADGIEHAPAIASRLLELEQTLGTALPTYLLLTKMDLVAGFNEFFASLSEAERSEVWGLTLPGGPGRRALDPATLEQGFARIVASLDRLLHERLIAERDVERRALILGFPLQIQLLLEDIRRFVEAVSTAGQPSAVPWLRGVYLTSGLQGGSPTDRLSLMLSESVGVPVGPAQEPMLAERGFFLQRLIHEVLLREAGLVGRRPRRERWGRCLRAAGATALVGCVAAIIAGWAWSYGDNRDRELGLERSLAVWSHTYGPLAGTASARSPEALEQVAPALDRLAAIVQAVRAPASPPMGYGLSRQSTLAAQAEAAYDAALRSLLLPRLLLRLERRLEEAPTADRAARAGSLQAYLMLGGQRQLDGALLTTWLEHDVGAPERPLARMLAPHLEMLVQLLPTLADPPALDEALIARVQAQLAPQPPVNRAEAAQPVGIATASTGEPPPPIAAKPTRRHRRP